MKIVTAEEMRTIDERTVKEFGILASVLMERAGLSVANKVKEIVGKRKVIVIAGGGNNGGDGIAVARNLHNWGWNVTVLLMLREDRLSSSCLAQYRTAKRIGVPVEFRKEVTDRDIHGAAVIDALLGTGLNRPVTSPITDVIRFLNSSDATVISVDIPSGISSDNGHIMEEAVRADYTVTFGLPKIGHVLYPGADYTGKLFIEDIGFPEELLSSEKLTVETIEKDAVAVLLPERQRYSHKGDYGHVLLVAGSRGKTGAALMAAKACMRSGAGMVTIGVPESLADVFQMRVTEEMVLPLPDTGGGILSEKAFEAIVSFADKKADLIAMGPGMTAEKNIPLLMKNLLGSVTVPMILDADAVNALSGQKDLLRDVKAPVILTPHAGEMARLLTKRTVAGQRAHDEPTVRSRIVADRIGTVVSFSRDTGAYLVLKGAPTIVSDPEGRVFINTTGNPGMATAGSGDVLTGMIAAFVAQGLSPLDAARTGVYLHGLSGDIAAREKGMHSLIATDVIDHIHHAFRAVSLHD